MSTGRVATRPRRLARRKGGHRRRLRRIEGQPRGLQRLARDDRSCVEILIQGIRSRPRPPGPVDPAARRSCGTTCIQPSGRGTHAALATGDVGSPRSADPVLTGKRPAGNSVDRAGRESSVAIATNETLSGWTRTFTDPRLCAAIMDRLAFGGNIIETGATLLPAGPTVAQRGAG